MRFVPAEFAQNPRFPGVCVALAGTVAFALLAWWVVPWEFSRGGAADPESVSRFFTSKEVERAEAFSTRARAWSWTSLAISLLCLGILATGPVRRRLVRLVPGRSWWLRVALLTLLVLLLQRVVTLPFAWGSFRLRSEYGLTGMGTGHWLVDVGRNFLVGAIPMIAIVLVVIGCARSAGRWWCAWAAMLLAGGVLIGSFAYPVLVEPLANEFVPLAEGDLRERIEVVAEAEGVAVDDVVVADASRRTTTLNAWVSGIGPTRRVVLYDTLVEEVPTEQVLVVVAHELAHARHSDVFIGTVLGVAGVFAAVGALALLLGGRQQRSTPSTAPASPAVVPVLLLLVALATQMAAPVQNGISRALERRADAVAMEMTQDPDAFIEVQMSLARRSLSDPIPPRLSHWWWGSHPTALERVAEVSCSQCP